MTPLDRIRAVALALPGTSERDDGGETVFLVADTAFARVADDGSLHVRTADGEERVELGEEADWTLVEDRVARGWELTAPAGLLEAGGR